VAIDRRRDLGNDDSRCVLFAQQHQLISQRGAAHKGNTGVNHVWVEIARLLNKFSRRPIGRDHDHRFNREVPFSLQLRVPLLELRDGIVHIHCITLVIEPQNWALVTPLQGTDRFLYAGETGVAVRILLGKDSNLLRQEPPYLDQVENSILRSSA